MEALLKSGSLFEVSVPEYKQLKTCHKEICMLKELWDMIVLVSTREMTAPGGPRRQWWNLFPYKRHVSRGHWEVFALNGALAPKLIFDGSSVGSAPAGSWLCISLTEVLLLFRSWLCLRGHPEFGGLCGVLGCETEQGL